MITFRRGLFIAFTIIYFFLSFTYGIIDFVGKDDLIVAMLALAAGYCLAKSIPQRRKK